MGRVMFGGGKVGMEEPSIGIPVSSLAVGSSVYLNENNSPVEYIVVNHGIPTNSSIYDSSCNGTWLMRKDISENKQWHNAAKNNYATSTIHTYLNSDFLSLFDSDTQNIIKSVKIPYGKGEGSGSAQTGANGLSAKIFLLSGFEVAYIPSPAPTDGSKLDYFETGTSDSANAKRMAYMNGTATQWHLRTPYYTYSDRVWGIDEYSGAAKNNGTTDSRGIRPTMIISPNALFDSKTLVFKRGA